MMIDDVDIDVWPDEYKWAAPWEIEAHRTFIDVVDHVRGVVADEDIAGIAWDAGVGGHWPYGLSKLLFECNTVGATVSDELLDRCLKAEWGWGLITQEVEELRARARDREAASG